MALTMAAALLVLPYPALPDRLDDRHSLDWPTWTLLREYLGSLAYALVLSPVSACVLFAIASAHPVIERPSTALAIMTR